VGADFRQRTGDCWLKSGGPPPARPGIVTLTPCITLVRGDQVAVSADRNFSDGG
jgi:hypothetical protein